ncbi:Peroxisomal N(1)-acetyl-spermine/spermidine oxidase-like protein, partial [Leptotrombidium deliense]
MKRKFRKFIDKNNNNGILDSQTANAVYNWCLQQIKLEEIYPWNRVNCSRKFNNFYDVKGGFKTFVSLLAQRLPENSIELCKHVIKIDYMDECVKVCTEDGCEYSAEHIIITSSVGYLKQNMDKLFFPPLPSRKLKAFKSIDFKTMNKVYLQVDECLPDMQFQLIWTSKKHTNLPEWVYDIFAIEIKTNCLLFWFDGKGAEIIENEPAASLASICLNVFELFVKDVKISKAKRIIASKWK